ncbi:zf-HC2 domain-containing protein [bacterium]|nr:zf-HC2 domain-containing protein [candidate division CSSED10-310 bacterium]
MKGEHIFGQDGMEELEARLVRYEQSVAELVKRECAQSSEYMTLLVLRGRIHRRTRVSPGPMDWCAAEYFREMKERFSRADNAFAACLMRAESPELLDERGAETLASAGRSWLKNNRHRQGDAIRRRRGRDLLAQRDRFALLVDEMDDLGERFQVEVCHESRRIAVDNRLADFDELVVQNRGTFVHLAPELSMLLARDRLRISDDGWWEVLAPHSITRLSYYVQDELNEAEKKAVELHLGRCRKCRRELSRLIEVYGRLAV